MVNSMTWFGLPQPLVDAAKTAYDADKFDDAIFVAFRYVESQIQERLDSLSVGGTLIAEAFDTTPPRIQIGSPITPIAT